MAKVVDDEFMDEKDDQNTDQKWFQKISVEPIFVLIMFAYMLTSVVEQTFYINRACIVNHGYSEDICQNISDYDDINKEVHVTVSKFQKWRNLSSSLVPIILGFFCGPWSDRRGRKLPLLLGVFGKFFNDFMLIINSVQVTWPIEYVIYTSTIPGSITGHDLIVFSTCYAYIVDITSESERTKRITILEISLFCSMPIATICGSLLFNHVVNQSYTMLFLIRTILQAVAIIYIFLKLEWQTTSDQQSITKLNYTEWFADFFNRTYVTESIQVLTKKRKFHKRSCLWICLSVAVLSVFTRDEYIVLFLYTHRKFHWDIEIFSYYQTFHTIAHIIMMSGTIPIMSKLIGFKDTTIAIIAITLTIVHGIICTMTNVIWLFYVAAMINGLRPISGSIARSILSKLIDVQERGKIFTILSIMDNLIPFISTTLYTQIYIITIEQPTTGIFWVTASASLGMLLLMILLRILMPKSQNYKETTDIIDKLVK